MLCVGENKYLAENLVVRRVERIQRLQTVYAAHRNDAAPATSRYFRKADLEPDCTFTVEKEHAVWTLGREGR